MRLALELEVKKTGDGFEVVSSSLNKLQEQAKNADVGGSAIAKTGGLVDDLQQKLLELSGIYAMGSLIKQSIELGDQLWTIHERTGLSVESLSVLKNAAENAGGSVEDINKSLVKMSRGAIEAVTGNEKMADSFEAAGINAEKFIKATPEQQLEMVAKGLAGISNDSERTSVAFDILGKGAVTLGPLMDQLANEGFQGVSDKAREAGLVMSTDAAAAADELGDTLNDLKTAALVTISEVGRSGTVLKEALSNENGVGAAFQKAIHPANLLKLAVQGVVDVVLLIVGAVQAAGAALGAFFAGVERIWGIAKQGISKDSLAEMKSAFSDMAREMDAEVAAIQEKTQRRILQNHAPAGAAPTSALVDEDLSGELRRRMAEAQRKAAEEAQKEQDRINKLRLDAAKEYIAGLKALYAQERDVRSMDALVGQKNAELDAVNRTTQALYEQAAAVRIANDLEDEATRRTDDRSASLVRQIDLIQQLEAAELKRINSQQDSAEAEARSAAAREEERLREEIRKVHEEVQVALEARDSGIASEAYDFDKAREKIQRLQDLIKIEEAKLQSSLTNLSMEGDAKRRENAINSVRRQNEIEYALWEAKNKKLIDLYTGLTDNIVSSMQTGLEDLFNGGSLQGAFDQLLSGFQKSWAQTVTEMASTWLKKLQNKATGSPGQWVEVAPNQWEKQGEEAPSMWAGLGFAGLQGAASLYGLYQQGQAGASPGQNMVSGAMTGASIGSMVGSVVPAIGNAVGAVIGAVIGAAAGYFTGTVGKSFMVDVVNGKMVVKAWGSANQQDVEAALADINNTIESASSGMSSLFDAFPEAIGQQMGLLDPAAILGGEDFSRWLKPEAFKLFLERDLPIMVFDAYAPMLKAGLTEMGVTEERLKELFDKGPGFDPKVATEKIRKYITVLAGFMNMEEFNQLSGADLTARAQSELGATPMDTITDLGDRIKKLAEGFNELTTDEQIKRGEQIIALEQERQQEILQFLYQLAETQKSIFKSIDAQLEAFDMEEKGPFAKVEAYRDRMNEILGEIGEAQTPQELQELASEYQQLVGRVYELTVALPKEIETLIEGFESLEDIFAPERSPFQQLGDLQVKIGDAYTKMSEATNPDDQVAAARELYGLLRSRYELEKQMLDEIEATIKGINESIDSMIADMELEGRITQAEAEGKTPEEIANIRIEDLMGRQRDLRTRLEQASSAEEINAIVAEMTRNSQELFNLMGRTPEAAAQLTQMLEDIRRISNDKLLKLAEDIGAEHEANSRRISEAIGVLEDALGTLPDAAAEATAALETLRETLATRFTQLAEDVAEANTDLLATVGDILEILRNGLEGTFEGPTTETGGGNTNDDGNPDKTDVDNESNMYSAPVSEPMTLNLTIQNEAPQVNVALSGAAEAFIDQIIAASAVEAQKKAIQVMLSQIASQGDF